MSRDAQPEINPYAPSAVAAPYSGASELGVGVWRDGDALVMHLQAALPPNCIRTGDMATRVRPFTLFWFYPFDWSQRRLFMQLPLAEAPYASYQRRERAILPAFVIAAATGLGSMLLRELPDALRMAMFASSALAMTVWFALVLISGNAIRFVRAKDQYLWIRGCDPRFLAQLPPWPGG